MPLDNLDFPRTINTSSHDIVGDFFVPMLKNAVRYDRGVGYFSSGWLRANAQGMVDFAANGGPRSLDYEPNSEREGLGILTERRAGSS